MSASGRSITDSTSPRGAISPDQTELGFPDEEYFFLIASWSARRPGPVSSRGPRQDLITPGSLVTRTLRGKGSPPRRLSSDGACNLQLFLGMMGWIANKWPLLSMPVFTPMADDFGLAHLHPRVADRDWPRRGSGVGWWRSRSA